MNCLSQNINKSTNNNNRQNQVWTECFAARSRQPVTALGRNLSELLNSSSNNTNSSNSKFYVSREDKGKNEDSKFFEDINTLSRRQALLFQKSCEQLKDLYFEQDCSISTATSSFAAIVPVNSIDRRKMVPASPKLATLEACPRTTTPKSSPRLSATLPSPRVKTTTPPMPPVRSSKSRISVPNLSPILDGGGDDQGDVDALYVECLGCLLHQIGCDADVDGQWRLVEHLRKVFG